jgi:hypothetical protein
MFTTVLYDAFKQWGLSSLEATFSFPRLTSNDLTTHRATHVTRSTSVPPPTTPTKILAIIRTKKKKSRHPFTSIAPEVLNSLPNKQHEYISRPHL